MPSAVPIGERQAGRTKDPRTVSHVREGQRNVEEVIEKAFQGFAKNGGEEAAATLDAMRAGIRAEGDEAAAAAAIIGFLKSGRDVPTRLPFVVGAEGVMNSTPTLRTALLDLLPALDPHAALDLAREIIRETGSPDEYAMALRNLAWNDLDGDLATELSAAFSRLLDRREWVEQPSAGFLEALDIALEVPSPELFGRLSVIASSRPSRENDPLLHAVCMTLDRMVLRDAGLLVRWGRDPAWLAALPEQRASLMSRLDPTDEPQLDLFLNYLADPRISETERAKFVALFPNGNYLHGHRLVSSDEPTLSISERQAMDAETLRILSEVGNRAGKLAAELLARIRKRLEAEAGN
ncbi:MAG: hypothetical protein V4733_05860 [Verrucomicrobiota bacterium]